MNIFIFKNIIKLYNTRNIICRKFYKRKMSRWWSSKSKWYTWETSWSLPTWTQIKLPWPRCLKSWRTRTNRSRTWRNRSDSSWTRWRKTQPLSRTYRPNSRNVTNVFDSLSVNLQKFKCFLNLVFLTKCNIPLLSLCGNEMFFFNQF